MPTTRTREAGLAALLAPLLVVGGQILNVTVPNERGPVHGIGVVLLVASLPALLFGLWGLVRRHGGLGRLGRAGFVLAVLAAPSASWPGGPRVPSSPSCSPSPSRRYRCRCCAPVSYPSRLS